MKNTVVTVPFLILSLGIVIGIIVGHVFSIDHAFFLLAALGVSVLILGVLKKFANNYPDRAYYFGIAILPTFILFGIFLVHFHNPLASPNHYTNYITSSTLQRNLLFKIEERLKPSSKYEKYIIAIKQIDTVPTQGTVLLYLKKDSVSVKINTEGEYYLTNTALLPIAKPLNPYQFDYSNYLKRQGIHHQIRLNAGALVLLKAPTDKTLKDYAQTFRNFLTRQLSKQGFSKKTFSLTQALILGQRQDLDPETYQNYINAGAIHILAVSGLHIGIFLWILNLFFRPLTYLKHGRLLRLILVIVILWCYAFITGLSPSVLRAVTMFSFIAIGQLFRFKKGSTYNALLISAFVLLCFDPLLLFDIGFQLSYAAVFAIFWVQPSLAKHYHPRYFIDRVYWDTLTVTIAAQLGVLPLSIYYFHQFPLLFFVTNLAIVPFLGILLGAAIIVVLLTAFDALPLYLVKAFNTLIEGMDMVVTWIARKEGFLWSDISLSITALIVFYLFLISGRLLLKRFQPKRIYFFGIVTVFFLALLIAENIYYQKQERLIIFHHYGKSVYGYHSGKHLTVMQNDSITLQTRNYILKPYMIGQHMKTYSYDSLKNGYRFKQQHLIRIDHNGFYGTSIHPDIILLAGSTQIHLDRVIDSLHPKQIVADGSSYPSLIKQWERTCKNRKIPFYQTGIRGAFILE